MTEHEDDFYDEAARLMRSRPAHAPPGDPDLRILRGRVGDLGQGGGRSRSSGVAGTPPLPVPRGAPPVPVGRQGPVSFHHPDRAGRALGDRAGDHPASWRLLRTTRRINKPDGVWRPDADPYAGRYGDTPEPNGPRGQRALRYVSSVRLSRLQRTSIQKRHHGLNPTNPQFAGLPHLRKK